MRKLILDFIDYLEKIKNYSSHTTSNYMKDLSLFEKFTIDNNLKIEKIEYSDIRLYLNELYSKNFAPSTINRHISSLRSFFKYLLKEGIIFSNPMTLVSNLKKEKKLPNYLNENDLDKLFGVPNSDEPLDQRNSLILELLYSTGIRVSELVNIKLNDINFYNQTIKILGKGNKERIVIFGNKCLEKLNKYLNDGSTWDDLDERINQTSWVKNDVRWYEFNNTKNYLYYRLYITENNNASPGTGSVAIEEFNIFE